MNEGAIHMRELTLPEQEIVSGGYSGNSYSDEQDSGNDGGGSSGDRLGTITTIGTRGRRVAWSLFHLAAFAGVNTNPTFSGEYSDALEDTNNDGDDPLPPECQTHEDNTDSMAEFIADAIMSQPDWNSREYGAIIYLDQNGDIQAGPLQMGTTMAETNPPQLELSITSDMQNGKILGYVHNHPDIGYNSSEDRDNRNPSQQDWAVYDTLVGDYGASSALGMYILGPDGILREFHASFDRSTHTAENNPRDPDSNNEVRNGQFYANC